MAGMVNEKLAKFQNQLLKVDKTDCKYIKKIKRDIGQCKKLHFP